MKGHFINGQWVKGSGASFTSLDSATRKPIWQGNEGTAQDIDAAIASARAAFPVWSNLEISERIKFLQHFREVIVKKQDSIAMAISQEVGKPLWDSKTEVNSMINKIGISIDAYSLRCPDMNKEQPQGMLTTRHRPHGVMGVVGPFNFPAHLPNGHIIPALLAGNTVVFKPSELTPLVAEISLECWEEANLPSGVINMVHGGRETGKFLSTNPHLNGLLFVGSWPTGKIIAEQMANTPDKILALEMGGNNPLIIGNISDLDTAAYLTVQSAFLTSGQRCTCARRLIVPTGDKGDAFLDTLLSLAKRIKVGVYSDTPEPFMGPVISVQSAEKLLQVQDTLIKKGGQPILKMVSLKQGSALLSPGIIDVTPIAKRADEEFFGPLLQVIRVDDLTSAITEANNTQYGLTAGILSDDAEEYQIFFKNIRAGVVNWNASLTGISGLAPFGGLKHSGNNRPSALYAADYCAYPVASLESPNLRMPKALSPGIDI